MFILLVEEIFLLNVSKTEKITHIFLFFQKLPQKVSVNPELCWSLVSNLVNLLFNLWKYLIFE